MLGTNGIAIPADCDEVATRGFIDFFVGDVDAALAFQSDNGIVTSTAAQEALLATEHRGRHQAQHRDLPGADGVVTRDDDYRGPEHLTTS